MSADGASPIDLASDVEREWRDSIAPFWMTTAVDERNGGFHGLVTNDLRADEWADKGAVLNARILWTFSRAALCFGDEGYLRVAARAYDYFTNAFVDREMGGIYWSVDCTGAPAETQKRTYAQAFAIYALAAYYEATKEEASIALAYEIFDAVERHCRDGLRDGYFETFERGWELARDQRLSEVDRNEKRSMNAHLHLLEAYAALARATGASRVAKRLDALLLIHLERIVAPGGAHLEMFFDERWRSRSTIRSLGHDVEASWLLVEAAEVLGDDALLARARDVAVSLATSVLETGVDEDGAVLYEADAAGIVDDDKHWWVQAEAIVGFVSAYSLTSDARFLAAAESVWRFVRDHLVDREHGEWYWKTNRRGLPALGMPKASRWKGPYHAGRMCFEVIRRTKERGGLDGR